MSSNDSDNNSTKDTKEKQDQIQLSLNKRLLYHIATNDKNLCNNLRLEKKSFSRKDVRICFDPDTITGKITKLNCKSVQQKSAIERKDKFNNIISKKINRHKVSFKDQFNNEKIADIKRVESYKKFNKLNIKVIKNPEGKHIIFYTLILR